MTAKLIGSVTLEIEVPQERPDGAVAHAVVRPHATR